MVILGYKYLTEGEAIADSNKLNIYYGIPTSEFAETIRVVDLFYGIDDNNELVFYIKYNSLCLPVLGTPYEFTIIENLDRNNA